MIQRAFWRQRLASLLALMGTLAAWLTLATRALMDGELLAEYRVSPDAIQTAYLALSLALVVILRFEPHVRTWLRSHRAARILAPFAGVISAGVVLLSGADQPARLFRYPLSLWVIIIHIIGLCLYLVWLGHDDTLTEIDRRLERVITGVLAVFGLLLIAAHIVSVGEFMSIDLPDEPWLASMAANFSLNNDLSPSFIASAYGTPDPILGRYYLLMGWWLRLLGSTSFVSLRLFPLLVAGLGVGITAVALRYGAAFTGRQTLTGIVALLGLSAFSRTSHNLRMDIGLAVYGALVLWGMRAFFGRGLRQKRWMLLIGAALYIGLETVPTIGLIFGGVIGVLLVIWWLRQSERRTNLIFVVTYGIAVLLAGMGYFAGHFLPDVSASFGHYQDFGRAYAGLTSLDGLHNPFPMLLGYYAKFSMILSPVELVIVVPAVLLLWRRSAADRWILGAAGLSIGIATLIAPSSYGYMALFAPLVAYAIAAAGRSRLMLIIGAAVLIPALVAPPVNDMLTAAARQKNSHSITETLPLLDTFPPGSIIVGEPLFWFALHPERTFISWIGVDRLMLLNQQSMEANLEALNVDAVICWSGYTDRCNTVAGYAMFTSREDFIVDGETYWILRRGDKPENSG